MMATIAELTGHADPTPKPSRKRKRRRTGTEHRPGWIPIPAYRIRPDDRIRLPGRPVGDSISVSATVDLPDSFLWIDIGRGRGFQSHPRDRLFVWNPRPARRRESR